MRLVSSRQQLTRKQRKGWKDDPARAGVRGGFQGTLNYLERVTKTGIFGDRIRFSANL